MLLLSPLLVTLGGILISGTQGEVGALARKTGVSVCALHHYHAIGLLCPSTRSTNVYWLYDNGDIERLQQIKSLRFLGFSLEEVRQCLDRNVYSG